jgi:hypothetical protein
LYKFFKYNGRVIDIEDFDPEIGHIFSREVLRMINDGENGGKKCCLQEFLSLLKKQHRSCNLQEEHGF